MKTALLILAIALISVAVGEELNNYVSTAAEVQQLLDENSKNCYLLLFVWKGETEIEEEEAKGVQPIFVDYPECYYGNLDVSKPDVQSILYSIKFEDPADNFGPSREVTRDDTPMLLAIVNGGGYIASGPKPHLAMKKELDELYRGHSKSDIAYEGAEPPKDDAAAGGDGTGGDGTGGDGTGGAAGGAAGGNGDTTGR